MGNMWVMSSDTWTILQLKLIFSILTNRWFLLNVFYCLKVIRRKTTAASNWKDCTRVDGKQVQAALSRSKVHGRYFFQPITACSFRTEIFDTQLFIIFLSVSGFSEKNASVFSREEAVWHLFLWAVLANQKEVVELFIYESSCKIGKNIL